MQDWHEIKQQTVTDVRNINILFSNLYILYNYKLSPTRELILNHLETNVGPIKWKCTRAHEEEYGFCTYLHRITHYK